MASSTTCHVLFVISFVYFFCYSNGLVHHLQLSDDTRGSFFIENFGFDVHGQLDFNISNIQVCFSLHQTNTDHLIIKKRRM